MCSSLSLWAAPGLEFDDPEDRILLSRLVAFLSRLLNFDEERVLQLNIWQGGPAGGLQSNLMICALQCRGVGLDHLYLEHTAVHMYCKV